MAMEQVKVKGMSCQHCVKSVTTALEALDGVVNVTVDLPSGMTTYEMSKPVDKAVVVKAINEVGFQAEDTA